MRASPPGTQSTRQEQKKGILFIGYFLSPHGLGRCVCEDLSAKFKELGYGVVTASGSPRRLKRLWDVVWAIVSQRRAYQTAYVEVYNGSAFIWAEIACGLLRLLKKPYCITIHGGRFIDFSSRHPQRVRRMLEKASIVTTPSSQFAHYFSCWRSDILHLPNAIDTGFYPYRRRTLCQPKLGWLRKFDFPANPVLAAQVISLLKREFPEIQLVMSGADLHNGAKQQTLEVIAQEGLSSNITITGFISRSQLQEWFTKPDIYLNTTNCESFGIAVVEAAACGLCIVTTNVGELPYIWEDGVDALLVPPNDPQAMAAAVKRILTDPELASRLSANARKKAETYGWTVILTRWEALFNKMLKS